MTGLSPLISQSDVPFYRDWDFWAVCVSALALFVAIGAAVVSRRVARTNSVIDLHNAWREVNAIDPTQPVGPDVRTAINALDLTASLWKHHVIDRQILFQSYWLNY